MRVIFAINENINKIKLYNDDFIITNQLNPGSSCIIINPDFSLCDEDCDLPESINIFFDELPSDLKNFRNTYYMRVFRPACSIIKQIENILLNESVSKLILIGGSPLIFTTLSGGEGEGEKFLYKSEWLFNAFLFQYFKDRIPIEWKCKNNIIIIKTIHFLRENLLFYSKLIKNLILSLAIKCRTLELNSNSEKLLNIFEFVNLPLQYRHLNDLMIDFDQCNKYNITPFNSILNRNKGSDIYSYNISFGSIFKALKKYNQVKSDLNSVELDFIYKNKRINLNVNFFIHSLKSNFVFYESNLISLVDLFESIKIKQKSYFVTDMTFGEDIILIYELSKRLNILHYNFQIVAMGKMLFPQMDLSNRYFLYSKKTLLLYQKYNSKYEFYLPVSNKHRVEKIKKSEYLILSLFTQPDSYTDRYLSFLNLLLPEIEQSKLKIKLIIKPHYRQEKIREFEQIVKLYQFAELKGKNLLASEIIMQSDFVLSMTSSILFESITVGCPAIIINIDGSDNKDIHENEICYPEINFEIKTISALMEILDNSELYKSHYIERRDIWLEENRNLNIEQVFNAN